jgi:hypothetical protein
MSLKSSSTHTTQSLNLLRNGVAVGIAGGLAEIVVVSPYSAGAGVSALGVARHVAAAVHLDATSAWTGLMVHLALAVLLGIALVFAWKLGRGNSARAVPLYAFMLLALAGVWAFNFFVVLPVLSPDFVILLPLPLTLASKLTFGWVAAMTLSTLNRPSGASAITLGLAEGG